MTELSSTPNIYEESCLLENITYQREDVGSFISNGAFSDVYKSPRGNIALKKFFNLEVDDYPPSSLIIEVAILLRCSHDHICRIKDTFELMGDQYVVLERSEGTLNEYYNEFDNIQKDIISRQLIDAVVYLHDRFIVHRDIKPSNILISNGSPRLIDFGSSIVYLDINNCNPDIETTTVYYRAPELVLEKNKLYNEKIDIWSLGCTIWELFVGRNLVSISDRDELTLIQRMFELFGDPRIGWSEVINSSEWSIYYPHLTDGLPPYWHISVRTLPIYSLLKQMLRYNPNLRASARSLQGEKDISKISLLKLRERYPKPSDNPNRKLHVIDIATLCDAIQTHPKVVMVSIQLYDELSLVDTNITHLTVCAIISIAVDFLSYHSYYYDIYLHFFELESTKEDLIKERKRVLTKLNYDLVFPTLLDFAAAYNITENSDLIANMIISYIEGEPFHTKISKILLKYK